MTQVIDKDFVVSFMENKPMDVEKWSFSYQGLHYTCYEDSASELTTTNTQVYILSRDWTEEECEQRLNWCSSQCIQALIYSHNDDYAVYNVDGFDDGFSLHTYMEVMLDTKEQIDLMYYEQPNDIYFDGKLIDNIYYPSAEWIIESYDTSEPYDVDYCEGKFQANYSIELLTTDYELLTMRVHKRNGYDLELQDFDVERKAKPIVCCDNMKLKQTTMTFDGGNSSLFFRPEVHVRGSKAELIVCLSCKKYH